MTARAKGLTENAVLYRHVFRNAMLIVIAGFPGAFISAFFAGALLIETIFSLDGLGLLGFESVINRDYPVVFATLYIFSLLGPCREPHLRPHLHVDRSPDRLRDAGGLSVDQVLDRERLETINPEPGQTEPPPRRTHLAAQPAPLAELHAAIRRGWWSLWIFLALFGVLARSPSSSPTSGRSSPPTRARSCFRCWSTTTRRIEVRRLPRHHRLSRPVHPGRDPRRTAGWCGRRSATPTCTVNYEIAVPAPAPPSWQLTLGGALLAHAAWASTTATCTASATGTGSAPTTRAATWSPACSTASASRSSSA
jgi:hypothetical protein